MDNEYAYSTVQDYPSISQVELKLVWIIVYGDYVKPGDPSSLPEKKIQKKRNLPKCLFSFRSV